jgi:hypothetical protein
MASNFWLAGSPYENGTSALAARLIAVLSVKGQTKRRKTFIKWRTDDPTGTIKLLRATLKYD